MSWKDLLSSGPKTAVLPWTGGNRVSDGNRLYNIKGARPKEFGWYKFEVSGGRNTKMVGEADPDLDFGADLPKIKGYLVGDRLIPDDAQVVPDKDRLIEQTKSVYMVEPGLERFARATVIDLDGKYIYSAQEFPQGPEMEVEVAYQDRKDSVDHVAEVTPALDLAFRWLSHQRELAEERRRELERMRLEEEARQKELERLAELRKQIGTPEGRRALAVEDFEAAAKAALQISGSELLDCRRGYNNNEMIVQYRYENRRLECVVDRRTLRIIDAGICLQNHATGEKGDTYFTLESLPGVVKEAIELRKLVVWRHVPGDVDYDPYEEEDEYY